MLKYCYIFLFTIINCIESKGSFPCPVRHSKINCENMNGCEWIIGQKRPPYWPPWLWVPRDYCRFKK